MDESQIKELVIAAFVRELEQGRKHRPPTNDFHISELVFDCPRAITLRRSIGDFFYRYQSIFRLNVGRKIHEIPILANHEQQLKWCGITGTPDEYGNGVLLEKKTTYHVPGNSPYHHHTLQTEYYKILLEHNNCPVLAGFVLYYDLSQPDDPIHLLPVNFRKNKDIETDMLQRKEHLLQYFGPKAPKQNISPRSVSWVCNYCDYVYMCFLPDSKLEKIIGAAKNARLGNILFDLE
jgi:CRISPR/Cas system-associated exonuclease Cas4 (RecB family)